MTSLIEKMARDECRRLFKANDDWIPRGKTIDDMVEKEWRDWIGDVKAQIEKVLDHFSDPENITEDGMARAATEAGICYNLMKSPYQDGEKNTRWQWRFRIAMAMKAAKEELK